jgi:multidrug efflux pump subunit AcrB
MIQTPFNAKYFYRKERPEGEKEEAYNTKFYKVFRKIIEWSLRNKYSFATASIIILVVGLYSFRFVKIEFMSKMVTNQFFVEYNLPQGSDIDAVERDIQEIQSHIYKMEGVKSVTGAIGQPPARYALMRKMPNGSPTYGEVIIETYENEDVEILKPQIDEYLAQKYPNAHYRIHEFGAAFSDYGIEAEFTGPDPQVLRDLANQAIEIYKQEPTAANITHNWRNKTKRITPVYDVHKAQKLNLSRTDMGNSILVATNGMPIGSFYEGDKQLPVILKTDNQISGNMNDLMSIPVWGQQSRNSVPLAQIVDTMQLNWENEQIHRLNGQRSIKAQCDAAEGYKAAAVFAKVKDKVEDIELPYGYELRWEGQVSAQGEANTALFTYLPLALGLMLIIIIGLFNNIKQPIIIFSIVPFALIGVVIGFIVTGEYLSFIGIIGALGLIGMMIKNSVVLLDEINHGIHDGKTGLMATIDAAISRLRPVMMASLTTILGMMPLLTDAMFKSLAITIMFGLLFGTIITLLVVPVLYAVLFKVNTKELRKVKSE